jgi:hypothetical protein
LAEELQRRDALVGALVTRRSPRWRRHRIVEGCPGHTSGKCGDEDLVLLAITDFGLTSAVLGDYDRGTRLRLGGEDAEYGSSPGADQHRSLSAESSWRTDPI